MSTRPRRTSLSRWASSDLAAPVSAEVSSCSVNRTPGRIRNLGTRCVASPEAGRRTPLVRHVDEAGVVALEGDDDVAGGAVTVLGHDQVRLAGAGGLLLVDVV